MTIGILLLYAPFLPSHPPHSEDKPYPSQYLTPISLSTAEDNVKMLAEGLTDSIMNWLYITVF